VNPFDINGPNWQMLASEEQSAARPAKVQSGEAVGGTLFLICLAVFAMFVLFRSRNLNKEQP